MQDAKVFEKQATPDFSKTCGWRKIAAIPSCNQMENHLIATWYEITKAANRLYYVSKSKCKFTFYSIARPLRNIQHTLLGYLSLLSSSSAF
jgi:hypothetical protein